MRVRSDWIKRDKLLAGWFRLIEARFNWGWT